MSKQLLAKDKRRWSKRKGITAAVAVGGGLALLGLGYYLYRKIIVDAPPKPGSTKDWSGCFEPPAWVNPRPLFKCSQRVTSEIHGTDGWIDGRTWTPSGSTEAGEYMYGQWTYGILWDSNVYEEGDLTEA